MPKLVDRVFNGIWTRTRQEPNAKNLLEKVRKLEIERDHMVRLALAGGRIAEKEVEYWLDNVNMFIEGMEMVGGEEVKSKKCFLVVCNASCQIREKVDLDAVDELLKEAANISDSYCPPPLPPLRQTGLKDFSSRMSVLNDIMEVLRGASIDKIGVYGIPGVGKTMLAREVARQAEESQLFDAIVMTCVTKNPDLKRIQGEIADKLGLQFHGETEFKRACQLKAHLKKMKKILVILDDIWTELDLDKLGIPFEDKKNEACSIGEEQMQCKILFTSTSHYVLSRDMGAQVTFEVSPLQDEEAWVLFEKIVGHEIEKFDLQRTAMDIVKECNGLPLVILTIGKALKNKSDHVWRDALQELKRPSPQDFTRVSGKVYSAIRWSFKHLEWKELQETFLLCCLLGHNASIEDLRKYGVGLGLFHNVTSIRQARDRVLTLVSYLKSCSLLLDGCSDIHFEMHNIVHDVGISIASRGHHILSVIEDYVPKVWLERMTLEDFRWISLQNADISELPDELECPQLTLFCLSSKDPFMKIPENIFRGMHELRVLNFTNMHFSSLPSSICLLKNLHTLHVSDSVLLDISVIGKLMSLKVLSLSGCNIEELPTEIGQLTQLNLLDLTGCVKLKVIRPHVLARLSKLEELYLGNSFNQWDIAGEDGNGRTASLSELKDLNNLTALDLYVCDVHLIPEGLFSERLESYKIVIAKVWDHWHSSFYSSRTLKLELKTNISYDHSICKLLKKTEQLHLEELKGVKDVVYELDVGGFQNLKYLSVQNAPEVQHIINSVGLAHGHAFPILEVLCLRNLNNLVKICHGQLEAISFRRLRMITVECCDQLKILLPFSVARCLLQLKEINIMNCSHLVEIVDEGQEATNDIAVANENFELVQLQSLKLQYLPNFIRLCRGNEEMYDSRSNPTPLFNEKIVFPNMEKLQLSSLNIRSVWGSQHSVKSSIRTLKKLIIEGCDHLEHLLSSSMAKSLVQLRCLEIKKCKRMREILEAENAEEIEDLISFPKLDILHLQHLENLTRFCSRNCSVEFTSLKKLWIDNCPELKGFTTNHTSEDITGGLEPLFNEMVAFPSIEELIILRLERLRIIWNHQPPADSFCRLKSLSIGACEKLLTIFPSVHMFRRLCTSLEKLVVFQCGILEEIFQLEDLSKKEPHAVIDTQLKAQLKELLIMGLPTLKHIWTKDPPGILTFQNLRAVTVVDCLNLQNIFPPAVAMELHQLEKLKLFECGIEEVVAFGSVSKDTRNDSMKEIWHGYDLEDNIVFTNLKSLQLAFLPRLESFCSGNFNFIFPSLKDVMVVECSNMLRFCRGELSTPELLRVKLTADKGIWEGDLNTTIQQFTKKRAIMEKHECRFQEHSSKLNTLAQKSVNDNENDPILADFHYQGGIELGLEYQIQQLGLARPKKEKKQLGLAGKSGSDGENDPTSEGGLSLSSDKDIVQGGDRQIQELSPKLDNLAGKSVNNNENDPTSEIGLLPISVDRDIEQDEEGLKELSNEEEWQAQKSIRAIVYLSSILPESPKCPFLVALSLEGSNDLMAIPSSFFEHMPLLQSLNLSHTSIRSLPISLYKLVALKMLILKHCKLFMELSPQVGELHNLEKLDLDETQIMNLPQEVGELSKLKILRLSFYGKEYQKNELIHPGTIRSLLQLTELSIDVNPDDKRWNKVVKVVIEEACSLKSLEFLVLYLPNVELLGKQGTGETSLISYPLSKFKFIVGQHKQCIISLIPQKVEAHFQESDKGLKFVKGEDIPGEMKSLLRKATAFYLDRHAVARSLCDFGIENMQKLEFCLLTECDEIQTIINGEDTCEQTYCESECGSYSAQVPTLLLNLQYLHIYYMENLVKIWGGSTYNKHCLSSLKLLTLHMCPKLSVIFTPALLANLQKLEVLIVEDCTEVTSLVSLTSHSASDHFLPSLKTMLLLFLPKLASISSGLCIAPKLENVGFYDCPELKRVSIRELSSENLKVIKGESEWWTALEWNNEGNRLDYLDVIFSPIDENYDLMKQMEEMQGVHESGSEPSLSR